MENLEIEVNDVDDEALAVEADIQVTCITICSTIDGNVMKLFNSSFVNKTFKSSADI